MSPPPGTHGRGGRAARPSTASAPPRSTAPAAGSPPSPSRTAPSPATPARTPRPTSAAPASPSSASAGGTPPSASPALGPLPATPTQRRRRPAEPAGHPAAAIAARDQLVHDGPAPVHRRRLLGVPRRAEVDRVPVHAHGHRRPHDGQRRQQPDRAQ